MTSHVLKFTSPPVIRLLAGALLALAGLSTAHAQNVRLMPMGDSITAGIGTSSGNGYRGPLWNQLVSETTSLNFVGSRRDGNFADPDNEGHSGWKIHEIAGIANNVLATYQPNLITLHIGTNDVNGNYEVATAPDRLSALIDQIFAAQPNVTLLVSTIITATNSGTASRIVTYNNAVRQIVQTKANAGRKIALVDMSSVTTADLSDGLHPNADGFQKMANAWMEGYRRVNLLGWLGTPPTTTQSIVGTQSNRCLDVKGASRADGATVQIWDCHAGANQQWTTRPDGTLQVYGNKCLDVFNHGVTAGSTVGIWACNGQRNQQWRVNSNGTIVGVESGLCLDVSGNATAGGSQVKVWTCHGGANQQWRMR